MSSPGFFCFCVVGRGSEVRLGPAIVGWDVAGLAASCGTVMSLGNSGTVVSLGPAEVGWDVVGVAAGPCDD